mmetsp:Transcript_16122/g.20486  ORF Transcript_16122/g.20486 Transcript_16122/m.20486 type:complete len:138 (+) Transcript_16122:532-945(+)
MPIVVMLNVAIFRRKFNLTQYLAVCTVICGLAVTTLSDIYGSDASGTTSEQKSDSSMLTLGIACMLLGQVFHAAQTIMEESIVKQNGGQEPCYMMGWEGVYGLFITLMIIMPSQLFGCPFSNEANCVNGHLDDMYLV